MTLKEFRELTKETSEDTIICNCLIGGSYAEVSSIEIVENETYINKNDDDDIGNLLIV